MKKNMGALDKSLRVLIAIIIALLYYLDVIEGTLAYVLMAISIIFLITSFVNFCPLYKILGINTNRRKS
ncbi:YgaP family membrane protein [Mesoflavibacter sp. CH_XMU1422-2]|uniref:YgaP family membrane protein n=1 Tax=Mesoflavibacter sp. CH_XMU1422-2 TaxID=3107770 RepID=UPI00300B0CCA